MVIHGVDVPMDGMSAVLYSTQVGNVKKWQRPAFAITQPPIHLQPSWNAAFIQECTPFLLLIHLTWVIINLVH